MQHTIGISDMKTSSASEDVLITYSLGSCVGITIYDPETGLGGLIHCMLPLSKIDPEKSKKNPCMFVDSGLSTLLQELFNLGASRKNMIAKLAGASSILDTHGTFKIGKRNYTTARKILWKNDILIAAEDAGGTKARTMILCLSNGETRIKSGGTEVTL